jgi:hypothetical protein
MRVTVYERLWRFIRTPAATQQAVNDCLGYTFQASLTHSRCVEYGFESTDPHMLHSLKHVLCRASATNGGHTVISNRNARYAQVTTAATRGVAACTFRAESGTTTMRMRQVLCVLGKPNSGRMNNEPDATEALNVNGSIQQVPTRPGPGGSRDEPLPSVASKADAGLPVCY